MFHFNRNIITQIALLFLGLFFSCLGKFGQFEINEIILNIGLALIAASLVALFNKIFADDDITKNKTKQKNYLGLVKVYENRSEINSKINKAIKESATQIDVITQDGLHLLLEKMRIIIKNRLMNDLRIRILIPLKIKEYHYDTNIKRLIEWWCNDLNETQKANCKIHFYDGTPLDLYFRINDMVFVGPYIFFLQTDQTTITYEFKKGTKGSDFYTMYFDEIWDKYSNEINIENNKEK